MSGIDSLATAARDIAQLFFANAIVAGSAATALVDRHAAIAATASRGAVHAADGLHVVADLRAGRCQRGALKAGDVGAGLGQLCGERSSTDVRHLVLLT